MTTYAGLSPRLVTMVLAALLIVPGIAFWAICGRKDLPSWSHEFPGKGGVACIAAGRSVDGTELVVAGGYAVTDDSDRDTRIVAIDASNGIVKWERRQKHGIQPSVRQSPSIAFDTDGNLVVGRDFTKDRTTHANPSLSKISSIDGTTIWEWHSERLSKNLRPSRTDHLALPAAMSRGCIWVSGIRFVGEREYERFLALLESSSGREIWFAPANQADSFFAKTARIYPLMDKDAIVFCPPLKHERSHPWVLLRVDESNGNALWRVELIRDNERNLPGIHCLVDEARGEVLVFWQEVVGGRWKGELIRYNLNTGLEVARHTSPFPDILSGGVYAAAFGTGGEVHLWGRVESERTHVNWLRWSYDPELPIPLPESRTFRHLHPVRLSISPSDGRVLSETRLSTDETPTTIWNDPVTELPAVMFVRSMRERAQVEPWSTLRLDGRASLPVASGSAASLHYPSTAAITPSGRIVTVGDPLEKELLWSIHLW